MKASYDIDKNQLEIIDFLKAHDQRKLSVVN